MALSSLQLTDFRNISEAQLDFSAGWNLLVGPNGAGKTSVLEAIYLLAHGRSFRSGRPHKAIRHQQAHFTLFARVDWSMQQIALGMQRDRLGDWQVRLNGEAVQRLADCAAVLPVQLLQPESFRLFFGGPKERRQFFDLGLFHVEPGFYDVWLAFQRVLRQRNALLKNRQAYSEQYLYWDQQLVAYAVQLQQLRANYAGLLAEAIRQLVADFRPLQALQVELYAGWSCRDGSAAELLTQLQQSFQQDLKFGYTQYGPQKADLRLKVAGEPVDEVLSRGQLKVLLFALKVAQSNLILQRGHKQPLLLIDDLASELDEDSKRQVFYFLEKLQSQVFITAIEPDQLLSQLPTQTVTMFHVEHGQIKRTDNDGRR